MIKKFLFWLCASLILLFWPLSFFLANTKDWLPFGIAAFIIFVDWLLYLKKIKYHYLVYFILPLIHPAYLALPIIATLFNLKDFKIIPMFICVVLLVILTSLSWKTFYAYSIFTPDPLAFDTLSKKISLIPNRNLSRIYENRTTIFQDKFKSNLFVSFDLNNYFSSLHPQEIGDNQNLNKFPYLAIIPFLLGLYYIWESKQKIWLISIFISAAGSIAFINNQDRFDLILFFPISLICLIGLKKLFAIK